MKLTDEELQSQIEKGHAIDGEDASVYKRIFSALKKEPSFVLPARFSDDIVKRIEMAKPQSSTDNLWFGLGIFGFVLAAIITIVLTGFNPGAGAFKFLSGYAGLFAFGIVFILLLNFFDKKFIRPLAS
jgi:uncharacterized sodium:solute symporter family permease YidK